MPCEILEQKEDVMQTPGKSENSMDFNNNVMVAYRHWFINCTNVIYSCEKLTIGETWSGVYESSLISSPFSENLNLF